MSCCFALVPSYDISLDKYAARSTTPSQIFPRLARNLLWKQPHMCFFAPLQSFQKHRCLIGRKYQPTPSHLASPHLSTSSLPSQYCTQLGIKVTTMSFFFFFFAQTFFHTSAPHSWWYLPEAVAFNRRECVNIRTKGHMWLELLPLEKLWWIHGAYWFKEGKEKKKKDYRG